jgi:HD-like signal output (HDOD) protein
MPYKGALATPAPFFFFGLSRRAIVRSARRLPSSFARWVEGLRLASNFRVVLPRNRAMPVDPQLRSLNIDIPAQPEALVKLSLLLADDDVNLPAVATLIESDMALASAVLKAVNSSLYGLSGRVQSVQQAITYLGTREVAGVTFEMGLRAVFPPAPELDPLWQRASVRGLLMGRIGQAIDVDPWAAHSAGLFEECGKAVLFRHAADRYRPLLKHSKGDEELLLLEHQEFGVSHDALGAALCETWGLAAAAVHSVRYHVVVNATRQLPMQEARRSICAVSALAHALMTDPDTVDEVARAVAPQAHLDETNVVRGTRRVQEQIEAAVARGGA